MTSSDEVKRGRARSSAARTGTRRRVLQVMGVAAAVLATWAGVRSAAPEPGAGAASAAITAQEVRTSEPTLVTELPPPVVLQPEQVESRSVASGPAVREALAHLESAPLSAEELALTQITTTFLSTRPDGQALNAWLSGLCANAEVLADSVTVSEIDGSLTGQVRIAGLEQPAAFSIRGDTYRLSLNTPSVAINELGAPARDVVVSFSEVDGLAASARTAVQFHPDLLGRGLSSQVGERILGWNLSTGPQGTAGQAITASPMPEAGAWRVGPALELEGVTEAWNTDTRMHDRWLALLSPWAR